MATEAEADTLPAPATLQPTQGPSWGYLKVNFSETLSTFGDKRPRNGSKNEDGIPPHRALRGTRAGGGAWDVDAPHMTRATVLHIHPEVDLRENLKSVSHRFHLFEVASVWEFTKATIHLPLVAPMAV